jgi:tetratricopeptide (TPR) repeat protein
VLAYAIGELAIAERLLEESRALWTELGDILRASTCLHNLADVAKDRGDYAAAERYFKGALVVSREHGDRVREALTLTNLGSLLVERGRAADASTVSSEAIGIYCELNDDFSAVWPRMNLAWSMLLDGNLVAARALFLENLDSMTGQPESSGDYLCECLEGLAAVAGAQSEPARALRLAGAAAHHRRTAGRSWQLAYSRWVDSWLQPLRQSLDPRIAQSAWIDGERMSLAETIEYARSENIEGTG